MKYVDTACIILAALVLIWAAVALAKNDNTYRQRNVIISAIHRYQLDCIDKHVLWKVDYIDMESYDDTDIRLFDWGYTNILPEEKFEIIKPFIEGEKK